MRWPEDWSEWILAVGIGLEFLAGPLIFVVRISQPWIDFPIIVAGLLFVAGYLLTRALRLRRLYGRFNLPTTLTFVQAVLAVPCLVE